MRSKAESNPSAPGFSGRHVTLLLVAFLAVGSGFLAFNFHQIIKVSHAHISVHHEHRHRAFCAFVNCEETGNSITGTQLRSLDTNKSHGNTSGLKDVTWVMVAPARSAPRGPNASAVPLADVAHVTKILSSRECGQPAKDGYAHVETKCLEGSSTAQWWAAYYKAGGRQAELVVHIEKSADYDGLAVKWGLNNKVASAEECAKQCLEHQVGVVKGPFEKLPCNTFTWCPLDICFEPDAHNHTKGDCWLKFTEGPVAPEVNYRGPLPDSYRKRHPTAPQAVQWVSGVLLPAGIQPTNGTYGPRFTW